MYPIDTRQTAIFSFSFFSPPFSSVPAQRFMTGLSLILFACVVFSMTACQSHPTKTQPRKPATVATHAAATSETTSQSKEKITEKTPEKPVKPKKTKPSTRKTETRTNQRENTESASTVTDTRISNAPIEQSMKSAEPTPAAPTLLPSQVVSASLLQKGEALRQQGKLAAAEESFRQAQSINNQNTHSYARLSEIAIRKGDKAEAVKQAKLGLARATTEKQKQAFLRLIQLAQAPDSQKK